MAARRRIFSGVQPTGVPHLGNYLGAISLWVAMQSEYEAVFCIADLHALTTPDTVNPAHLRTAVRDTAAILLASGVDPAHAILFVQSRVPAHAELAWLLGTVTPVGWLERMIQFKTRSAEGDSVGAGLLAYPVLQAADILLYRTDVVPVGEDQRQHIELTRDIARRFHGLFGEVFTLPEAVYRSGGARIMGLDDPDTKMSKSAGRHRARHAIGLVDPPDRIRDVIMRAVTDGGREVRADDLSPGVANLVTIYQLLTSRSRGEVLAEFEGKGYAMLKASVAEAVISTLDPIQQRYRELSAEPEALDAILDSGAERARPLAGATLERVKRAMGLDAPPPPPGARLSAIA